jgi:hypothetical protein
VNKFQVRELRLGREPDEQIGIQGGAYDNAEIRPRQLIADHETSCDYKPLPPSGELYAAA